MKKASPVLSSLPLVSSRRLETELPKISLKPSEAEIARSLAYDFCFQFSFLLSLVTGTFSLV